MPSMPGGFPTFFEVPSRQQQSIPRQEAASDTDTTYSSTTYSSAPSLPKPPKGILKNASNFQPDLDERRLAARFYRVPRPVQTYQPFQNLPLQSPTFYPSDNSTYGGHDAETDVNSTSSELSVNTQATSMVSASSSSSKRSKSSVRVRHVRQVRLPTTASRVRARPRTRAPSEATKSEVTKGPSQSSGKRTVHIQFVPNKTIAPNKTAPPQPQSMQVARIPSQDLVRKLEQLESDTEDLRNARGQLVQRLGHTSDELSARLFENQQIARALYQERNTKELILRDLSEQRRRFDEFRNDFEWQQSVLAEVERERDSLRQARGEAEDRLVSFEKDMSEREQKQQEQDELLRQQITKLAIATAKLEEKVATSDSKLKSLATERDDLKALAKGYKTQINILKEVTKPLQGEREAAEEFQKKLQLDLDTATADNQGLQAKITNLEENIVVLQAQITEFEGVKKELEDTIASERASKSDLEKSLLAEKDEVEKLLLADKDEVQKQLIAEKEELERQLEITKGDLETTKGDLEKQLDDTKKELEKQLEDMKKESEKQLEDAKVTLETHQRDHDTESEELRQEIEAVEAAKNDLEIRLRTVQEDLGKEIAKAMDELEKRGATWQADKDDKQSTIDGLMTELAGAKNANISLASQRLEVQKELTEVQANLVTVQAELTDLQASYKTLEADNEQLKAQTGDLTQKAADLDQLHTAKTAEIEKLQGEHAVLDDRIKGIQADLDAAQAARATLEGEKEKMAALVKELEDGSPILTRLKGEKAELDAQLSSLQAEADKVAPLTQANADLETRASALQGAADKVPALEMAKTALEGRIALISTQASLIPGLRDQIERLNGQIRDMQNSANTSNSNSSSSSRQNRQTSRSTSRAPSKRHGRSPSNAGLLFVRSPSDKGHVYVTTREALAKEKEKGE